MKKYDNLYGVYQICDDTSSYELSANIDFTTGKFYMPGLAFRNIKDKKYPKQDLFWDDMQFVYNRFYPFLVKFLTEEPEEEMKDMFEEIYEFLDNDECQTLIDILDKGRELNWDLL